MEKGYTIKETNDALVVDDEPVVSAYIMADGEVVSKEFVEKSKKVNSISNLMDTDIDEFGQAYSSGSVYLPPLNLNNLKVFSFENPYHQRCINQIAVDCCSGYDIVTIDKNGKELPDDNKRDSKEKLLFNFFDNINPTNKEIDILELLKEFLVDYNTFGFGVMELIRDRAGRPCGIYPAHADTFRIGRQLSTNLITDEKFMLQIINVHERIFKIFGTDKYRKIIEPHTGNVMSEILFMKNYHIGGKKYGIPNWFPALKAMLGNDKVAEYNITFFNNEAVPRFAVIVEGGKLGTQTKNVIKNYFKKNLKGTANNNKTLVLSTPKGASIKLVPLATDNKDGSFRFYKKDNRDEIVTAHGVPHHRIQVMDVSGGSGTMSKDAMFQLDKIYKYSIITPLQHKVEVLINSLIKYGFGIDNKKFKLNELDIGEEAQKAETMKSIATAHEKYVALGVMQIDEVRRDIHLTPYNDTPDTDEDVKEWAKLPRPIYLVRQAMQQQAQMQSEGLNGNMVTGNLNERPNEFDDKSREQTQGNTQFTDDQLNQLLMKKLNSELESRLEKMIYEASKKK